MDSNETNLPLTEVPMDKTPETLVSSPAQAEENNTMYVPKQTKEEVIKRLKTDYSDLYNDDNVMLTATHTHVGNAGYSHQQL